MTTRSSPRIVGRDLQETIEPRDGSRPTTAQGWRARRCAQGPAGRCQSPLTAGRGRGRSETKYPSGEYEIVQGRSDPFTGRECHRTAAHRATRQRRRRRRGARNTPRGNSMVDTSVERPAKIPRVPTQMRSARRSGAPRNRDETRGDRRGAPTLSSAGALTLTLCETPGGARPAPEDAPPAATRRLESARGASRTGITTRYHLKTTRQGRDLPTSTSTSTSSNTLEYDPYPPSPTHPPLPPPRSPTLPTDVQQHREPRSVQPRRSPDPTLRLPVPLVAAAEATSAPKFAELERLPGHGRAVPP